MYFLDRFLRASFRPIAISIRILDTAHFGNNLFDKSNVRLLRRAAFLMFQDPNGDLCEWEHIVFWANWPVTQLKSIKRLDAITLRNGC